MNQLKHIFGLPITISQSLRSSSISRSAGSNGRDAKRCREILTGPRSNDHSPELILTDKSYSRLIADYSKEFEVRNNQTKCNADLPGQGGNMGFFPKTPLQRMSRMTSLKNRRPNNGSSLNINSCQPSLVSAENINNRGNACGILDETDVLEQVIERADWLDKIVEAHRAKRAPKVVSICNDLEGDRRNLAHPLVDKTANSNIKKHNKVSTNGTDRRSEVLKNIPSDSKVGTKNESFSSSTQFLQTNSDVKSEISTSNFEDTMVDSRNVSVTVKPFQDGDVVENKYSSAHFDDNTTFVVTVSEESKSSSTTEPSPLRHIDLRINGEPVTGLDTVIRKVEKFDVVSLAEKIEIRIPILSDTGGTIENESHVSTSTINLCISSRRNDPISASGDGKSGKIYSAGDSISKRTRSGSAHSSMFHMSKLKNNRIGKAPRSKVIPWWTTEESFRRSEIVSARSSESASVMNGANTSVSRKVAARGNSQRANDRDAKEIAISDAKMRMKMVVTKPSSSRQRLKTKRQTSTTISKIIENELRKKSEEKQKNVQRHVLSPGVTKSVAKHETKVKSTGSNELKKGTSSAIVDGIMPTKSDRAITPTLDNVSKKMLATTRENVEISGVKSTATLESEEDNDKAKNNNSSKLSTTKESVYAKPITVIAKNNNDHETRRDDGTMKMGETKKIEDSLPSKIGSEPRSGIGSKSDIVATPQIPKTYNALRTSPAGAVIHNSKQSVESQKQNNHSIANNSTKNSNVKNPTIIMKPIEKKKDGTLIDYGLTVPTRKKSERKLPDSKSTATVATKKTFKKAEPVVMATIKEVLPKRHKNLRSSSINRSIVYPAKLKQNDTAKTQYETANPAEQKYHPCKSKKATSRMKTNGFKDSKIPKAALRTKKNTVDSSESNNVENMSPEKKLLYSVWLRRTKDGNDDDPNSAKDPRKS